MIKKLKLPQTDPYHRPNEDIRQLSLQNSESSGAELEIKTQSIRFSRRKFAFAVTAFVLGAVLVVMQSPARNDFLAPGPLASHHAQILAGQGAQRCAACHDVGNQDFSSWIASGFRSGNSAKACQSELCMKCHQDSISKKFAVKPHNVDPKQLARQSLSLVSASRSMLPTDQNGDIQCSACHREHHGLEDLKKMTDQQCQSCHSKKYHRFETDHPEFVNWPQKRRQRIAFDHTTHHFKHFPGKDQSFDCKMCHVDDRLGNVKLLASYEQTCGQCHDKDITVSSEQGLSVVSLPMLDLSAIKDQKLSIGDWPENASGDFDGQIPELMKVLLYKNKNVSAILESRGEEFEFGDLDPEDPQDVRDAVQLAWAIKYLLFDLATEGGQAIRQRLEFALQHSLSEAQYVSLTKGLDAEVFARTANQWLPNLAREVPLHREQAKSLGVADLIRSQRLLRNFQDEDPELLCENPITNLLNSDVSEFETGAGAGIVPVGDDAAKSATNSTQQSGDRNWLTEETETRPELSQQRSPVPIKSRQESAATTAEFKREPVAKVVIPDEELLATNPFLNDTRFQQPVPHRQDANTNNSGNQQQVLADRKSKSVNNFETGGSIGGQATRSRSTLAIPDDQLLAVNPLSGDSVIVEPAKQPANSHSIPQEETSRSPMDAQIVQDFVERVEQAKAKDNALGSFEVESKNEGRQFISAARQTGWYRNDQVFQISFRPAGHADKLMTTLLDVVAETPDVEQKPAIASLFRKMMSESSVGGCVQCHTVDEREGSFQVNWSPEYRDPLVRSFTRFSHRPHLTQPQLQDCKACHAMDENQGNAETFNHFDSSEFVSNFRPITKANCIGCHFKGSTSSGCTQCHNYHIGSRVTIRR